MHREENASGDEIVFGEEDLHVPIPLSERIPVSEAPALFKTICVAKEHYGRQVQMVSVAEAYDEAPTFRDQAKNILNLRFNHLERMAKRLSEIAGGEIIDAALADVEGLDTTRLHQK